MVQVGELKIRAIIVDEITKPIEKISRQIDKMNKSTKVSSKGIDNMSKSFRGFNASLLSVMFGSTQLSKTFDKMLSPVEDAIGLQEYWNAIMIENTIDAIDPSIEALETAGQMFEYVNNVTGGTLGQMFLFGRAVGDTMGAVSQSTLFFEGLITQFANIGKGGGLAADAIAQITGTLIGMSLPFTFFNENNLKVANAYLSDVNAVLADVNDKTERQKIAIKSLDDVIPTLYNIFISQKSIDNKVNDAITSFNNFKAEVAKEISTPGLIDLNDTLTKTDTQLTKIKQEFDTLPLEKKITLKVDLIWDFLGTMGKMIAGGLAKSWYKSAFEPFEQIKSVIDIFRGITGLQEGGTISKSGIAYVHKGETVVPAGTNIGFSPTVNVYATMSSPMDVREIGRQLLDEWHLDLRRLQM